MHEHHPRATPRRASPPHVAPPGRPRGRAHTSPAGPRRRLSHQTRAALARTRLLEIEHEPAAVCLVSQPRPETEHPVRVVPAVGHESVAADARSASSRRQRLDERRARARVARRVLLTVVLLAGLALAPRLSEMGTPRGTAAPAGAVSLSSGSPPATAGDLRGGGRDATGSPVPPPVKAVVATDLAVLPPVEIVDDPDAYRGHETTLTDGSPGTRRETYEVVSRDGSEVSRVLIDSQILVAPRPRVVAIGTKAPRDDSGATGRLRIAPAGWQPESAALGRATWYQYKSGTCAHNTLPKGTLVRVTNLVNGRSTLCVVADRGIRDPANLIDLAHDVFDDLAPRSQGVVHARIEW